MKRAILLCLTLTLVAFLLTACNDRQVVAKCVAKTDNTSVDFGPGRISTVSFGIMNTHHFEPGDVIELIPPAAGQELGTGSRLDTLSYKKGDFQPDDPPATTSNVVATDFELDTDADVKAFSAEITAALKQNTILKLSNGSRHSFAHPLQLILSLSNQPIRVHILNHPRRTYIIVTGVINADSFDLEFLQNNDLNGTANLLKIPGTKYNLHITYNCSNITNLKSSGKTQAGLAFFYTTVAAVNGKVDTVTTADLTKYNLSNARTRRH
jgi:hypothetical protein